MFQVQISKTRLREALRLRISFFESLKQPTFHGYDVGAELKRLRAIKAQI